MMSIFSGRYGTVVSYLRLMFWTPSPTLETSSLPSLRRPMVPVPRRRCRCSASARLCGSRGCRERRRHDPLHQCASFVHHLLLLKTSLATPMAVTALGQPA